MLNVAITQDGQVLVNNEEVDEDGARAIAKTEVERNPEVQAVIIADRELQYGQIIRVLDWIKSSGVKSFAVTTDKPLTQ
jgi:biopolymer transport protein ExbD